MLGEGNQGSAEFRARFISPNYSSEDRRNLSIALYKIDDWENFQQQVTCADKWSANRLSMKVSLTNDGKWTEMPQRHISAIHYTQIFYFVVFDCDKSLHQYNPEIP